MLNAFVFSYLQKIENNIVIFRISKKQKYWVFHLCSFPRKKPSTKSSKLCESSSSIVCRKRYCSAGTVCKKRYSILELQLSGNSLKETLLYLAQKLKNCVFLSLFLVFHHKKRSFTVLDSFFLRPS